MIIHRARIDMAQDNSILADGKVYVIEPGNQLPIELVVDTSLFDTIFTTIVFGIFVDYECLAPSEPLRFRIPSDQVYLFQRHRRWKATECHFVYRDRESIRRRREEAPEDPELQALMNTLDRVFETHTSKGIRAL